MMTITVVNGYSFSVLVWVSRSTAPFHTANWRRLTAMRLQQNNLTNFAGDIRHFVPGWPNIGGDVSPVALTPMLSYSGSTRPMDNSALPLPASIRDARRVAWLCWRTPTASAATVRSEIPAAWRAAQNYTHTHTHTHTRSTQPCIPPGSLNRVPASAAVRNQTEMAVPDWGGCCWCGSIGSIEEIGPRPTAMDDKKNGLLYFGRDFSGSYNFEKIVKTVATRCHMLKLKCTELDFGWDSTPDPITGVYSASQSP